MMTVTEAITLVCDVAEGIDAGAVENVAELMKAIEFLREYFCVPIDGIDETFSQLQRRLPLGTRVRHSNSWEGTVVGYEYGQVGVKVAESETIRFHGRDVVFCYGRNVAAVERDR
jgi:hypothetical protein